MQLVIAEKPSVAQSIAAVIGAKQRGDGYMKGAAHIVSWCVGHFVELAQPESYDERYAKWKREDLPILPERWQYAVPKNKEKQLKVLRGLMSREDVEGIVCATDAGREGELIFRLVYAYCGCKKPVQRLWISSMEESTITEGFRTLKSSATYDNLYQSALCRSQADWLVGINATRLFSVLYGQTLNVGRVQSPTLAMLVRREAEIAAFTPTPFLNVIIALNGFAATSERLQDRNEARRIAKSCLDHAAIVKKVERRDKADPPPKLYDLTTLQREANRLYGYTAQQTLDYTQSLYEKKLCTYPRTDSRNLTEDMADKLPVLINATHQGPALHERLSGTNESGAGGQQCQGIRPSRHHPHYDHAGNRSRCIACRGTCRSRYDSRSSDLRCGKQARLFRNGHIAGMRGPYIYG